MPVPRPYPLQYLFFDTYVGDFLQVVPVALLAGGLCLLALQALNRRLAGRPLALRCLAGAGFITGFELAVGLLCNRLLGWRVWDYSAQWGNLWGQVCPRFSAYWYLLCLALLPVLDRADLRPRPGRRPPGAERR